MYQGHGMPTSLRALRLTQLIRHCAIIQLGQVDVRSLVAENPCVVVARGLGGRLVFYLDLLRRYRARLLEGRECAATAIALFV
jgi:hypothetical protein